MEDQYYDIERRTAIKEEARMFRREYLKEHETITRMELWRILNENAPKDESNRFQQLTITKKKLQEYFPVFYTKSQMEKVLYQLLEEWKKQNNKSEG